MTLCFWFPCVASRNQHFEAIQTLPSLSMFPVSAFSCSYEDGQVGDANINTQEGGIHKEILRVIGNQTATG